MSVNRIEFILIVCIFIACFDVNGQTKFGLKVQAFPGTALEEEGSYNENFPDSLSRHRAVQDYLVDLYSRGYLAASFDSLQYDSVRLTAFLRQGNIYKWVNIDAGEVDEGVLSRVGFRDKLYQNKPFNHQQVRKLQEAILEHYENNGYPFVSVRLSKVNLE